MVAVQVVRSESVKGERCVRNGGSEVERRRVSSCVRRFRAEELWSGIVVVCCVRFGGGLMDGCCRKMKLGLNNVDHLSRGLV